MVAVELKERTVSIRLKKSLFNGIHINKLFWNNGLTVPFLITNNTKFTVYCTVNVISPSQERYSIEASDLDFSLTDFAVHRTISFAWSGNNLAIV